MPPLTVIGILFVLSLAGAYVLFRWLESTAVVKLPFGQFGGAVAALIGLFLMLFHAYQRLDVKKDLQELRLPDNYAPYVSEAYGFGFGYPKKYSLKTQGSARTESIGTIELAGSPARLNVSVIRFDDAESFETFRSSLGAATGSLPGVITVTAADYPAGGLRGKLLEAEPVAARADTSHPEVSPSKTLVLPNPARKVAYLFSLNTCHECQFSAEDLATFKDIVSTVQVSQR